MVYLLHLDTETQNSHLYTSEKTQNGSHNSKHGEYTSFKKKGDSETKGAAAEVPCKFGLKCQGFYTDGHLNGP